MEGKVMEAKWDIEICCGENVIDLLCGCTWAEVAKFIDFHDAKSKDKCSYTVFKSSN